MSSHPKQRHSPYAVLGYRFLLRLYPRELRERYGRDLVELIEDSLCGEGRYSVTRWARTILNLATNALRVRLDAIWNAARSNPKRTFNMRIDSALQDLRFGMRMLRKHPGLSLIVILTFGLGIGYTSTVFNITSGFVHKELPFEDSERILSLDRTDPAHPIQYGDLTVPVHDFLEWRAQQTSFERLAAYRTESKNLSTGEGRPERHKSGWITTGVFETLRVQPLLGRTFVEGEELPGAEKVIVLGYDLWLNRFDGATDILGRTVFVDAVPRTVIGVMPEGFTFPLAEQFWLPAELDPSAFQRGDGPRYALHDARSHARCIADRLREHCQPAAGPCIGTSSGGRREKRARREPQPFDHATSDRSARSGSDRRQPRPDAGVPGPGLVRGEDDLRAGECRRRRRPAILDPFRA